MLWAVVLARLGNDQLLEVRSERARLDIPEARVHLSFVVSLIAVQVLVQIRFAGIAESLFRVYICEGTMDLTLNTRIARFPRRIGLKIFIRRGSNTFFCGMVNQETLNFSSQVTPIMPTSSSSVFELELQLCERSLFPRSHASSIIHCSRGLYTYSDRVVESSRVTESSH